MKPFDRGSTDPASMDLEFGGGEFGSHLRRRATVSVYGEESDIRERHLVSIPEPETFGDARELSIGGGFVVTGRHHRLKFDERAKAIDIVEMNSRAIQDPKVPRLANYSCRAKRVRERCF